MEASLQLPPEIILQILSNLDGKSLLNCRLTCVLWNNLVLNQPSLLRKITCTIDDIQVFRESTIFSKIASIKIRNADIGTRDLQQLLSQVGLQRVALDFDLKTSMKTDQYDCEWIFESKIRTAFEKKVKQFFRTLVSRCDSTWTELQILGMHTQFLRKLTDQEIAICGSKIKHLTLDLQRCHNASSSYDFLLSLPNLSNVKIINSNGSATLEWLIIEGLCEHIQIFPGCLKVVELADSNRVAETCGDSYKGVRPTYYQFLLTAQNLGIDVRVGYEVFASLNTLNYYIQHHGEPAMTEEHCRLVTSGRLTCSSVSAEDTRHLDRFRNLSSVVVTYLAERPVPSTEELSFLNRLPNLRKLIVRAWSYTVTVPVGVVQSGLPALQYLETTGDLFRAADFALFPSAFPLVREMILHGQKRIPLDLFCSLGTMENLEFLKIEERRDDEIGDSYLTDNVFTQPCEVDVDSSNTKKRVVPAVASFKCLKRLVIAGAYRLTDVAITEGIALASCIDEVVLRYRSKQFSSEALNAIESGRCVRVKQIKDTLLGVDVQLKAKRV